MSLIDVVTQCFFVCETEKHCDCNCISFETVRSLVSAFLSSVRPKNTDYNCKSFETDLFVLWLMLFFRLLD